jgi:hypothetical protein
VVRGRLAAARNRATAEALEAAVWLRAQPLLHGVRGTKRIQAALAKGTRKLVARYRTVKTERQGKRLVVTLLVTVDRAALRRRLRELGVTPPPPGILVTSACGLADLAPTLRRSLQDAGIATLDPPASPSAPASAPAPAPAPAAAPAPAPALDGAALLAQHRDRGVGVLIHAACREAVAGRIPEAGVIGVAGKVLITVHAALTPEATPRELLRLEALRYGHDADARAAATAAVAQALAALAPRFAAALGPRLPAGLARHVFLRVRGALSLAEQLDLAQRIATTIKDVSAVTPRRYARGEVILAATTRQDAPALRRALAALPALPGWRLTVGEGPRPGWVDLSFEMTEADAP